MPKWYRVLRMPSMRCPRNDGCADVCPYLSPGYGMRPVVRPAIFILLSLPFLRLHNVAGTPMSR